MSVLAGCFDARNMVSIKEVTCPRCHTVDSIEAIERDGTLIGENWCEKCGYLLPEGIHLMELLRKP